MFLNLINTWFKKAVWRLFEGTAWFTTVLLYMNDIFPSVDIGFLEDMDTKFKIVFQVLSIGYFLYVWYDKYAMGKIKRLQEREDLKRKKIDNELKNLELDTAKKN